MKTLTSGLAALCLSFLATSPATASTHGDEISLRYKFKAGEKLHYVMEQKTKIQMDALPQPMEISQTTDITWEIASVDPSGKAEIKQRMDRLRFSTDTPAGKEEYDSKGAKREGVMVKTVAPLFDAMAGAEFKVTMDPSGRITKFEVPQKVTDALKAAGGAGLGEMFSQDHLKHLLGGIELPVGPVTKGRSWTDKNETKMSGIGKMIVETNYKLEGPTRYEGRSAEKIVLKPKVTLEGDAPFTVTLKDQDGQGAAYFDRAAGRLLGSESTQTMKMQMNVAGRDLTQTMEQKSSMKLQGK
jgi:hypothetical protein